MKKALPLHKGAILYYTASNAPKRYNFDGEVQAFFTHERLLGGVFAYL